MKKLLWQTKYVLFFVVLLATYLCFGSATKVVANFEINQLDTNKIAINTPTKSGVVVSAKKTKKRCVLKRKKSKSSSKVDNNMSNNPTLLDSIQKAKQKGKGF